MRYGMVWYGTVWYGMVWYGMDMLGVLDSRGHTSAADRSHWAQIRLSAAHSWCMVHSRCMVHTGAPVLWCTLVHGAQVHPGARVHCRDVEGEEASITCPIWRCLHYCCIPFPQQRGHRRIHGPQACLPS